MKLACKIFLLIFCLSSLNAYAMVSKRGLDATEVQKIDAVKNARLHSNMGNIYFEEKKYIAALKEYEIAYMISEDTQAAGTYLYNIARCFMQIGNYELALNAIKGAIEKDCMNLVYYQTLVNCYYGLGNPLDRIEEHLKDTNNPYNRVIIGLIYLRTGQRSAGIGVFDEFINDYPDMLISDDIRFLLDRIEKNML